MRRPPHSLAAALLLLGLGQPACAQDASATRLTVRQAEHPGRGRLVFDWPRAPEYSAEVAGDRLLLHFPEGVQAALGATATRPVRNALSLTQSGTVLEIALRPGVRVRHFKLDNRLVVDLLDPGAPEEPTPPRRREAAATQANAPQPAPPPAPRRSASATEAAATQPSLAAAEVPRDAAPEPRRAPPAAQPLRAPPRSTATTPSAPATPPDGTPAAPEPVATSPLSAPIRTANGRTLTPPTPPAAPPPPALPPVPQPPVPQTAPPPAPLPSLAEPSARALPAPTALSLRVLPAENGAHTLLLPFPDATGAALLRRGPLLILAFDSARPLDVSALRDVPLLASAEATSVPGGTVLRIPLAAPASFTARREGTAWVLQVVPPGTPAPPGQRRALALELDGGDAPRLIMRATQPSRIVALTDPESGLPLLLGTVREANQAIALPRRLPQFDLPATLLGAAVLARADSVTLSSGTDRFAVAAAGGGRLALDGSATSPDPSGPGMTRSFELPDQPAAQLLGRLRAQQMDIAGSAPLARGPARLAAAETLLALGLAQEAQAMAGLAMAEDPTAAADPRAIALAAAAALLGGRLQDAAPLNTPELPESDELGLWRALLASAEGEPARAAPGLQAALPLLLDYPATLRGRLLPQAAEALALADDRPTLKRLLEAAGDAPGLELPRAMLAEAEGRDADARKTYEALSRGNDRRARAIALRRTAELKLKKGELDAAAAAKALDATLFAWRGDAGEVTTRRRIAELRQQAGDGRGAMALLQETLALYPEFATIARPALQQAFLTALEKEPPLAAVALHDAYPDMLADDPRAEQAISVLAERLIALDLTDRATALLRGAAERAGEPPRRAALGLRLATLQLGAGDAAGALAALETTQAENLPEQLSRERVVLAARAEARRGNLPRAVEGLRALGDAGQLPLSELLAEAQDWPAAATAGAQHLAQALPAAPAPLDDGARRLLVRQAALLALAGDSHGLAALREAQGSRVQGGPLAEAFALLTAESLRGLADLPRLQRELQLFRTVPGRLEALRAGAPVTR